MQKFVIDPRLRTWAEVDLDALRWNLNVIRATAGPDAAVLAVVKANAYGHGVRRVVPALKEGVAVFGVANLSEAAEVFEADPASEVMLLSPCHPGECADAVARRVIVTVSSADEAAAYASSGTVRINFKVDTGMGRAGALPGEAMGEFEKVLRIPNVVVHSVSTHLPVSDEDETFTARQLAGFEILLAGLRERLPGVKVHTLNSAGILRFPAFSGDLVRAGLALYGCSPLPEFQSRLKPALSWRVRATLVRELPAGSGISYGRTFITSRPTRTALLAVGYADGFPRSLSGKDAAVLFHGTRCPLLGRVTMDQIVVDVSHVPTAVREGDVATLIGTDGHESISASEMAGLAGTITWDILTGIKGRVARVYSES